MNFYCKSDTGLVRTNNEDYVECLNHSWCNASGTYQSVTLLLLADGMGGAAAGEFASMLAVKTTKGRTLEGLLQKSPEELLHSNFKEFFKKCFMEANKAIFEKSQSDPNCMGMGTTIVAGMIIRNNLTLGHVGDSRAYLFRNGQLKQITRDHSYVQELIDRKEITVEQAKNHPNKNIITRALGVSSEVEPELQELTLQENDLLLFCTDGLNGYVEDKTIEFNCKEFFNIGLATVADKLISAAKLGGGGDNVSVVLYNPLPENN
ncbi:MAG: Stp1/IreP family PP2C-type Ser/Thr phosphatase [Candidatus Riflebacteria bacterium]|nr:Stp1/IreP family PP2C-type Ser/Thr phosphatase [Candidatus Riflebacteria bacterium]